MDKQEHVKKLIIEGKSNHDIMVLSGCSQTLIYKVRKKFDSEIKRAAANVSVPVAAPAEAQMIQIPDLDPAKPAIPQLAGMATKVLALAAAGADIPGKQQQAAREILKLATKYVQPEQVDRHFVFKVDTIDVNTTGEYVVTDHKIYEVKP